MNDSRKACVALLALMMLVLAGCAGTDTSPMIETEEEQTNSHSAQAAIVPSPMLQKAVPTDLTKNKQIITEAGTADFAYPMTLEEIAPRADVIVEAVVTEIDYTAFNGVPWTKITASTENVLYGDLSAGSFIDVYVYGGYVPLKDFIAYRGLEHHFTDLTEEEIEASVLYAPKENEDLPIEGEKYLFFLKAAPSEMPEGSFQRLGQIFCTFHIEADGQTYTHVPLLSGIDAAYAEEPQFMVDSAETVTKDVLYAQIEQFRA